MASTHTPTYKEAFEQASRSLELETQLPTRPRCRECEGTRMGQKNKSPLNATDHNLGLPGLTTHLPAAHLIPKTSILHDQADVNSGAYNHPVLILTHPHTCHCHHHVFVAPVTSFKDTTLAAKYSHASALTKARVLHEYLAIRQHSASTIPHNTIGELDLCDDAEMPRQSYVHLDHGFWVEWHLLSRARWPRGEDRRLTDAALKTLKWAYAVTESFRRSRGPQHRLPSPERDAIRVRKRGSADSGLSCASIASGSNDKDKEDGPERDKTSAENASKWWDDENFATPVVSKKKGVASPWTQGNWRKGGSSVRVCS